MKTIKSFGKIENGGFYPRNPSVYYQQLKDAGNVHDCLQTIEGTNKRTIDQNSYAFAVCNTVATRLNQDGWTFTAYEVYKKLENDKCIDIKQNEKTGKTFEYVRPLKEYDTDEFFDIVEEFRQEMMMKLQIHINTPAEHYGLTEKAYDLMRMGTITYLQAKKMSDKELSKFE